MEALIIDDVLTRVRAALEQDNVQDAAAIIESLHPADQAKVFSELDDEGQTALLPQLDPADSADILEKLDDYEAAELVSSLSTEDIISIIDEMEPDEAADLLGDIDPEQAQAVLAGMETPEDIQPLLLHADNSAGGLMTSEFLALRTRMTAAQAIQAIREWKPEADTAYYLFVVDDTQHLRGVINLRQLIVAAPSARIENIMDPEVISVLVGTDQEECARLMSRYDLLALPVVSTDNLLLGIITVDDVVDVLVDEATEDIQRLGGTQPLERSYLESGVLTVARSRIGWLLILFLTASLTGTVMRYFEAQLQEVVALTFFIPLLIGTGGNAGSQTTTTIIRALGVGDIDLGDAMHSFWHELRVGVLLGIGMAIVAYIRAVTWGSSPALALSVSLAILGIVVWANGLGSTLPLLAARLGVDPAIVSGPAMSTLVDATGLFIYFTIASLILGI